MSFYVEELYSKLTNVSLPHIELSKIAVSRHLMRRYVENELLDSPPDQDSRR